MRRTPVNPWPWSPQLGYHQAQLSEGVTRRLVCSGQTSVDAEGRPQHPGDMRLQIVLALDNLEAVLRSGGMGLADLSSLRIYATDVGLLMQNYGVLGARLGAAGAMPPTTVLGVTALAIPPLMVEIEAVAEA